MNYGVKEEFLKWATLLVSVIAILLAFVRYPIAMTLKGTVQDVVHQEMVRYEPVSSSDSRWDKNQESLNEVLKRVDRDLAALREIAGRQRNRPRLFETAQQ